MARAGYVPAERPITICPQRIWRGLLGSLAAMLLAQGCAPATVVQKPSAAVVNDLEQGKAAVALIQIRTVVDGKLDRSTDSNLNIRLYFANVDNRQPPQRLTLQALSAASAADGWAYVTLATGSYYLLMLPPGVEQNPPAVVFHAPSARYGRLTQYKFDPGRGGFWSSNAAAFIVSGARPQDFQEIPGYWFVVPPKSPVIYLGSVTVNCSSGKGLFGNLIGTCSDFSVSSAAEDAHRVAITAFPNAGAIGKAALISYGKPATPARPLLDSPIALSFAPPGGLASAEVGALAAAPTGVIHGVSREIGLYNLLALTAGGMSRAIARSEAQRRSSEIQPCVEKLSKEFLSLGAAGAFTRAFAVALPRGGVSLGGRGDITPAPAGASDQPSYTLTGTPERVALRECGSAAQFCLELAMRVRVVETSSGLIVYDSTLLHSSEFLPLDPLDHGAHLYERLLPTRSPCVPLATWCGEGGIDFLKEALNAGAMGIAAQYIRDISSP